MASFPRSRAAAQSIGKMIPSSKISTRIVAKTVAHGVIVPVSKTDEVCSTRQLKVRRAHKISPLTLTMRPDGVYAVACDGRKPLAMKVEGPQELKAIFSALTRCAATKGGGAAAQNKCAVAMMQSHSTSTPLAGHTRRRRRK